MVLELSTCWVRQRAARKAERTLVKLVLYMDCLYSQFPSLDVLSRIGIFSPPPLFFFFFLSRDRASRTETQGGSAFLTTCCQLPAAQGCSNWEPHFICKLLLKSHVFWFLEGAPSMNKAERRSRLLWSGVDGGKRSHVAFSVKLGKGCWVVAGKADAEERPGGRFEFRWPELTNPLWLTILYPG